MSGQLGFCRSCGAEVLWVETEKGKKMPLDAEPHPHGNIVLVKLVADGREVARYTGPWNAEDYHALPHFNSHFATCADGDKWRKRG